MYKINEIHLGIIKFDKNSKLKKEYVFIENKFEEILAQLADLHLEINFDLNGFFKYKVFVEENREKLLKLVDEYKYCKNISGAFQGEIIKDNFLEIYLFEPYDIIDNYFKLNTLKELKELFLLYEKYNTPNKIIDFENKPNKYDLKYKSNEEKYENELMKFLETIRDNLENENNISNLIKTIIKNFWENLKFYTKIYSFKEKYIELQENNEVLLFTHREKGWAEPVCKMKDFSGVFDTNFGYGRSSYFYLIVKFKDFQIVPYSELILYRYIKSFDIKKYTRKYGLSNSEWDKALNDFIEMYNLYIEDEIKFVEKYVVNEVEKLIEGLIKIDNFKVYEDIEIFYSRDKNQEQKKMIIEYKDIIIDLKKIYLKLYKILKFQNSLEFIENLTHYKDIDKIKKAIDKIIYFNKKSITILPFILKNIEELEKELNSLKEILDNKNSVLEIKLSELYENKNYSQIDIIKREQIELNEIIYLVKKWQNYFELNKNNLIEYKDKFLF